jgi:hypothetical protein
MEGVKKKVVRIKTKQTTMQADRRRVVTGRRLGSLVWECVELRNAEVRSSRENGEGEAGGPFVYGRGLFKQRVN